MSDHSLPRPDESMGNETALPTSANDSPFAPDGDPNNWRAKLDPWLDRGSEWLNPILVKESRQAFKSRQFVATFSLLLICCWLWSLFLVAIRSPGIYYAPAGRTLLVGYYLILVFPLVIIIPFSAFRSLAAERDDGTYELLSISTLRPRQIITGKMSSSMLQMLIYLSVLTPCMTFSYLLRGVDIAIIILLVFYSALGCWFLSGMGLMLATLTGPRHWQVFASVFFILLLAVTWFTASMAGAAGISEAPAIDLGFWGFWYLNGAVISGLVAGGAMFLMAATARITPRSENRSTFLRFGMFACQLVFFFWCIMFCVKAQITENVRADNDILLIYQIWAATGWVLFGGLMIGEDHLLSPRIRRGLPQSALSRVFLTLFYPGPGTGYLFAIANMFMMFVGCCILSTYCDGGSRLQQYTLSSWVLVCYMTIYLGIARLILRWMGKHSSTGPVLGLLTLAILAGVLPLLSMIVQFATIGDNYTLFQLPNVFWTFVEVADNGSRTSMDGVVSIVLSVAAFVVFLLNMMRMSSQLQMETTVVPKRVVADEERLNPTPEPEPVRSSPWDDDEAS